MAQNRTTSLFLLCLSLAAGYGCYLLIAPFLKPILYASVAAVLFYPMYRKIQRRVKNRTLASLLATFTVILLVVTSSVLLGRALAIGVHEIYDSLDANGDGRERLGVYLLGLTERAAEIAGKYIPVSTPDLHTAVAGQAQRVVGSILNSMAGVVGGITAVLVNTLICCFILFFLFRDGKGIVRRACVLLPLRVDQARRLLIRMEETLQAIVYGTLAIAALQGTLTGIAFWTLGLASPILWATVTALCALVPVIGTGFVLVPAISMLAFSGHWIKALILLAWGFAIVHPIDNVLRPYLIGRKTNLSTLLLFFSLLGGLRAFGTAGVFLGPVILATALALFGFLLEEIRRGTLGFELLGGGLAVARPREQSHSK